MLSKSSEPLVETESPTISLDDVPLPPGAIPLENATLHVLTGGAAVHGYPGTQIGTLDTNEVVHALAAWFRDRLWLMIPWRGGFAWLDALDTDFQRSAAYGQVSAHWIASPAVMDFRRGLAQVLMRKARIDERAIAEIDDWDDAALRGVENRLTNTLPAQYSELWQMQERLQLPDPFEHLPVQPPFLDQTEFQGFGPTSFAHDFWQVYYEHTRGLNNGLDYIVSEGTPLIAVADGVIVEFAFLPYSGEPSLALRPYLPPRYRQPDGARVLSNLVVGYGHLTGDPTSQLVQVGQVVRAGQMIGTSGWPLYVDDAGEAVIQVNNPHLHLETHLVTDGQSSLGSSLPFNPLLFWTPRLIALQARLAGNSPGSPYPKEGPFGRLGFFSLGCFRDQPPTPVWEHTPSHSVFWPEGVYDLGAMVALLGGFSPFTRQV